MVHVSAESLVYPRDATITDILLHHNFNRTPSEKPAIIDGPSGATVYTYESFRFSVKRVANYLSHHVISNYQTVVAVLMFTSNHFPVFIHGVLAAGGVVSAFNPLYKPAEISHSLKLAQPKCIFVEIALLPNLLQGLSLAQLHDTPSVYIWTETNAEQPAIHNQYQQFNILNVIRHSSSNFTPRKLSAEAVAKEPAFISFSSGTSGLVKGVMLSHGNIVANIFQQSQRLQGMFTLETVMVLVVPFFHILGLTGFSCQFISQGAPIVIFKRFDLPLLLQAIKKHRITHMNIVPPIALEFLQNPAARNGDYSSVKCLMNAAAPLSYALADQLCKLMNCTLTQWYGMTEASPSVITQREDEVDVKGTVGRILPGIELKIIGENGQECEAGQEGELQIRGPNVMGGYVGPAELTQDAVTEDGFFKTGDIGYIDEKGYVFIVDRAKEMIKVKGNQVAPAELESILLVHPQVEDAAVSGLYVDSEATEYPVAYITTKVDIQHHEKLKKEIIDFVNNQVAPYKRLRKGVHILPAIPRNPSGKILRRLLPAKSRNSFSGTNHRPGNRNGAAKI